MMRTNGGGLMLLIKDREKLKVNKFFSVGRCSLLREQIKGATCEEERKELVRELNKEQNKLNLINKQLKDKQLGTVEVELW